MKPAQTYNTRWMNLKQAHDYCNINSRKLVELILSGKIKGGQHQDKGNKDWFVDRDSIDNYMEGMICENKCEKKALEIMRRVG